MAIIGITIGATFSLSLIAGPVLGRVLGVPGVFAMTGVLALAALTVVRWVVPDPPTAASRRSASEEERLLRLLRNPDLARLNWGIFVLHGVLMALFVVLPFALRDAGLPAARHWQVYLPVMVAALLLMLPALFVSERRGKQKPAFLAAVCVMLAAQIALSAVLGSVLGIALALVVFFAAFNLLEASLPSLVTKLAPANAKGTATGLYSSAQFLGTFAGAAAGGVVSQYFGTPAVFALCGLLTLSWLLVAWPMSAPAAVSVRT
jgi:predicted MFS family arabinose efflux permease